MLRSTLWYINIWPSKEIGDNYIKYIEIVNFVHFSICSTCFISIICYVINRSSTLTFYDLCHSYITLFMTFVAMSRIVFSMPQSTKYRDVTSEFLNKMHLFYFKDGSDYAMKTHKQIHLISHLFTVFLIIQMILGCFLFNFIPMWNNYSSGKYRAKNLVNRTYEHAVYLELPFIHTDFNAYVVYCIILWIITYLCSTLFCMLDLFLSLIAFNMWGHLKILLHDLDSFPMPKKKTVVSITNMNATVICEMYSEEELIQVSQKLQECIDYHRVISNFTNKISDAFGPILLIYYTFHQVSGCLLLLVCSQMTAEALMRYLPLSIILFQQLIQLSVVFELIGTTSEKLKDSVYGVPWQYMDTKNRKTVAIFLVMVQEPIHVKALGVVNVGVTTMAAILKTSMSYFTFLRSM